MKFDEPLPSLSQGDANTPATFHFTLERGPFAGKTFSATLDVCLNPCCACSAIAFHCEPLPANEASAPGGAPRPEPADFDLDVSEHNLNTHVKSSSAAVALGRAVVAELQPPDWEALADFFRTVKRHQMKSMDLAKVRAQFPGEVLTGGGSMVGYVEVFPWAHSWNFQLGADWWLADDQYCVRPGCTCTQTALTFFRLPERTPSRRDKVKPQTSLRYDYVSQTIELIEVRPGVPAADKLMQALEAAHPNFEKAVRQRHRQLQLLGKRLLKNRRRAKRPFAYLMDDAAEPNESIPAAAPAPVVARHPKVGRNEPCPCGSGKKFKKCCGA